MVPAGVGLAVAVPLRGPPTPAPTTGAAVAPAVASVLLALPTAIPGLVVHEAMTPVPPATPHVVARSPAIGPVAPHSKGRL